MALIGLKHLKISPLQKVMHHTWPLSGIFASIFYAYFSGQIVLFFNKRPIVSEPITDFESLVTQISEERYRLILVSEDHGNDYGILDWARQHSPQMLSSVRKSFREHPIKILQYGIDFEAELLNNVGLPVVAPVTSITAVYLKSKFCGLATAKDDQRSPDHYTVFYNQKLRLKGLTESQRTVYANEFWRIYRGTYPLKMCYSQGLEPLLYYAPIGMVNFYVIIIQK